jgi:hypothetical protein
MLDYFVFVPFNLGNTPGEFRVGNQVISWGESTFIQGGINVTNPFDVASCAPGAELKEALVPQGMVYFSLSPSDNFSMEAYYQYDWRKVVPDPVGQLLLANDLAGPGGTHAMLGFGAGPTSAPTSRRSAALSTRTSCSCRAARTSAKDSGQYGIALRYFADQVMGGMEFGLYYLRYHSRLPVVSGRTGTQAGFGNAQRRDRRPGCGHRPRLRPVFRLRPSRPQRRRRWPPRPTSAATWTRRGSASAPPSPPTRSSAAFSRSRCLAGAFARTSWRRLRVISSSIRRPRPVRHQLERLPVQYRHRLAGRGVLQARLPAAGRRRRAAVRGAGAARRPSRPTPTSARPTRRRAAT